MARRPILEQDTEDERPVRIVDHLIWPVQCQSCRMGYVRVRIRISGEPYYLCLWCAEAKIPEVDRKRDVDWLRVLEGAEGRYE